MQMNRIVLIPKHTDQPSFGVNDRKSFNLNAERVLRAQTNHLTYWHVWEDSQRVFNEPIFVTFYLDLVKKEKSYFIYNYYLFP